MPWPPAVRLLLLIACLIVVVEGLAFIVFAVADLVSIGSDTLGVGLSAAVFFLFYGGAQLVAAAMLLRGRTGARGLLVASQLLHLGLAWSLRDAAAGQLVVPGLPLIVAGLAAVVLACLLAPSVNRAVIEVETSELGLDVAHDD
ncbi:MAG: hypothetical protein QM621_05570 [Aeromicrobium sp.]|uniref:hypothetical protein n=1 Tax=Aeromicrobium sp. TaxID=1871063 RepID=UPI0039E2BDC0